MTISISKASAADTTRTRAMSKKSSTGKRPEKKGGKFFPALCNIIGTFLLLLVIAVSLPLTLPRLLGVEAYHVETGSMEPAIPVGSLVYVDPVSPETLEPGDIVAFRSNETVITHRVVENHYFYSELITKGDANEKEDINPVRYDEVIGRVTVHFPVIGRFLSIYELPVTRIYMLCLAACGVMLNVLAGRIRTRQEQKFQEQLEEYDRRRAKKARADLDEVYKGESLPPSQQRETASSGKAKGGKK